MTLPFSQADFFTVFTRYNESVRPLQIVLYALALAAVLLAFRVSARSSRIVYLVLALLWFWMGAVYHASFFAAINPAAIAFAAAFVVQSLMFLALAARRDVSVITPVRDVTGVAGGILVMTALAIYPVLNVLASHRYPAQPTFGVPCPTTIFTFGILLWVIDRVPRYVLVIPLLWAGIATFAAVRLGVIEDLTLSFSAIVVVVLWLTHPQVASRRVSAGS